MFLAANIPAGDELVQSWITSTVALALYQYHNFTEIKNALMLLEAGHPDISRVYDIGDGWQKTQGLADRDILAFKVSDNVSAEEPEPEVLILGLMHAREWPSAEVALALASALVSGYGTNQQISWLVDNREIWIVPVVNPDGLDYALSSDAGWRKNMRDNGDGTFGVDLNRNFAGSSNDDPAGEWGGVGASHSTSDAIYCGAGPFSEPETQAIRDLVQSHNFSVAVDLHTFGRWVMWPWGYTNETAPDSTGLQNLGTELASLSGYYASQSNEMYNTTGDSLDWMYGSAGIYSYCLELGGEFHPLEQASVDAILSEGVAMALQSIEAAGLRAEREITIECQQPAIEPYSTAGFVIDANISATAGVNTSSLRLVYRIDSGPWTSVGMTRSTGNDSYSAVIPRQLVLSTVQYYLSATDSLGIIMTAPLYAPYALLTFTVYPSAEDLEAVIHHEARTESYPGETAFVGSGIMINATVDDPLGVSSVVLHYSPGRALPSGKIGMETTDGSSYSAIIPSEFDSGVDYWIEVVDNAGQLTTLPATAPANAFRSWNSPPAINETVAPERVKVDSRFRFQVNATDDYGVESFEVKAHRGQSESVFQMSLDYGNRSKGVWSCELQFNASGEYVLELVIFDGRAETRSNVTIVIVKDHSVTNYNAAIVIATCGIVAIALVALLVIRARRS